jgi:hypothetical protein
VKRSTSVPFQPCFPLLLKMCLDLIRRISLCARIDFGGNLIEVGKSLRRKKVIEVFGLLMQIVAHNVGDIFVNACIPRVFSPALSVVIELFGELNFRHIRLLPFALF